MRNAPYLGLLLAACSSHGGGTPPSSTPIPAVTSDAIYVVNGGAASISVLDAATDQVIGTIQFTDGAWPHHISRSDADELFVAFPGHDLSQGHAAVPGDGDDEHDAHTGGAVARLAAATGETLAAVTLDDGNHNALLGPDGQVWTALATTPGEVAVLAPDSLDEVARLPVGAAPSEISLGPDGARLFVADTGSDSVTVIDGTTRLIVSSVPVGDAPVGAWPGADGFMYVDNELGQSITVLDPIALEIVRTIDLGFVPGMVAVAPTTQLWVTDPVGGRLVILDGTSGAPLDELALEAGAHAIVFSPTRQHAWITNQDAGTVSVVDTLGLFVRATIPVGAKPNGLLYREAP